MKYFGFDTLMNLFSGLGVSGKDRNLAMQFQLIPLNNHQLETAYRGDWVSRKVIRIPAQDATRRWREWMGDSSHTTALVQAEKDMGIQQLMFRALVEARLYGGVGIILGIRGQSHEQPLDIERIRQGDLLFSHVIPRTGLTFERIVADPSSPLFGRPEYFLVNHAEGESTGLRVHSTRVVTIIPNPLPGYFGMSQFWGDSSLQAVDDAVKQFGLSSATVASMLPEAKIDVLKIQDFLQSVTSKEYREAMIERMSLVNQTKSTLNTMLVDKQDEWERVTTQWTGLPDIVRVYMLISSGAADIPATRFFAQSPAGLSSTGESDLRNYYDGISSQQEQELSPAINVWDQAIVRSTLGEYPEGLTYRWRPLWQLNDKEIADRNKVEAETFQIDVTAGLIDPELMRRARLAQLSSNNTYPGFAELLAEYGDMESLDDDEGDDPIIPENRPPSNDPPVDPEPGSNDTPVGPEPGLEE